MNCLTLAVAFTPRQLLFRSITTAMHGWQTASEKKHVQWCSCHFVYCVPTHMRTSKHWLMTPRSDIKQPMGASNVYMLGASLCLGKLRRSANMVNEVINDTVENIYFLFCVNKLLDIPFPYAFRIQSRKQEKT